MRQPRSLNCTLTHPFGDRPRRRAHRSRALPPVPAAGPNTVDRSTQPSPVVAGGTAARGGRSQGREVLLATAWLTGVAAVPLLTGFNAAAELVLVGVMSAVAGMLVRRSRLADRALAALVGTLLFPVLLVLGLAVRLTSPGPVLIRQARAGREGRAFPTLRFRTTISGPEPASRASTDTRPTRIGRILRPLCLDELPQLLDVIRGDVSLLRAGGH